MPLTQDAHALGLQPKALLFGYRRRKGFVAARGDAFGLHELIEEERAASNLPLVILDHAGKALNLPFEAVAALLGALLVRLVLSEPEDVRQDLLALGRLAVGELVGAPLEQKGGVDERLVAHPQRGGDQRVGVAHAVAADAPPRSTVIAHLKIHHRLATLAACAAANNPPKSPVEHELEVDLHLGLPERDQFVVALGAGAAPQGPCHRVKQRGLAGAVLARQTHDAEAVEVERRHVFAIAHEVMQRELVGNHQVSFWKQVCG